MAKLSDNNDVLNNLRQQMEGWEKEGYDVSELKMLLLSVDSRSSAKSGKPSRKLWLYIFIPVVIVIVIAVVVVVVVTSSGSSNNTSTECAPGCEWSWIDDGECDSSIGCYVSDCFWDGSDCFSSQSASCAAGCQVSYISDGYCDSACNNEACNYDGGDCHYCAGDCKYSYLGDGVCDSNLGCNAEACQYDGGDCR